MGEYTRGPFQTDKSFEEMQKKGKKKKKPKYAIKVDSSLMLWDKFKLKTHNKQMVECSELKKDKNYLINVPGASLEELREISKVLEKTIPKTTTICLTSVPKMKIIEIEK